MPGTCIPGCFCPDGLVRKGDKCVKPIECRDCEYNSQSLCPVSQLFAPQSSSLQVLHLVDLLIVL
jgi:hypothetical protein